MDGRVSLAELVENVADDRLAGHEHHGLGLGVRVRVQTLSRPRGGYDDLHSRSSHLKYGISAANVYTLIGINKI